MQILAAGPLLLLALALLPASTSPPDPVSPEARTSSDRGLAFLLSAQNPDGSWGDEPGSMGDVGNTCIGALALMGAGSTPARGVYWRQLRKAVDWVSARTRGYDEGWVRFPAGTLLQRKLGDNADLYLVSLLYSQLLGMNVDPDEDRRMHRELSSMCRRISSLQKQNGEWETSYEPMLTTVCAWLSLKQACAAGVAILHASPEKVVEYLRKECLEKDTGIFREKQWNRQERFVTQAGALRVFYGMDLGRDADTQRATQVVLRMKFDQDVGGRHGGEEFLGALFATQALFLELDASYRAWYPKIVAALCACQNRDGSWTGHHCITGRVFCTSCSVLAMLTPDRMLPMVAR